MYFWRNGRFWFYTEQYEPVVIWLRNNIAFAGEFSVRYECGFTFTRFTHKNRPKKKQNIFCFKNKLFSGSYGRVRYNTMVFFTTKQNSPITVVTILFEMKINGLLILIYYTSLLQYFIICHSFANWFRGPYNSDYRQQYYGYNLDHCDRKNRTYITIADSSHVVALLL